MSQQQFKNVSLNSRVQHCAKGVKMTQTELLQESAMAKENKTGIGHNDGKRLQASDHELNTYSTPHLQLICQCLAIDDH